MLKVTENDFRLEEFKDKKPDDYEFRDDGKLVRKDRWEDGIRKIAALFTVSHEFEIDDLVNKVRKLKNTDTSDT